MTSEKNRDFTNDFKKVGVCVKSSNTTVEYQNRMSENICGSQIGQICSKGCMAQLKTKNHEILSGNYKLFRNTQLDNDSADTIIIHDGEKITTLLFSQKENIQKQLNTLAEYNLTKSELNIMKKFLEGHSNIEITKSLFISKSTLRTHLNNIYKKIPFELKEEILDCHFGRDSKKTKIAA